MLYLPDEDPSETNEFTCYEAKIEESEKAGSCQESNPGHLWLDPPLSHDSRTTTNPHNPLYVLPIVRTMQKYMYSNMYSNMYSENNAKV